MDQPVRSCIPAIAIGGRCHRHGKVGRAVIGAHAAENFLLLMTAKAVVVMVQHSD